MFLYSKNLFGSHLLLYSKFFDFFRGPYKVCNIGIFVYLQGPHSDWKTWENGRHFSVRENRAFSAKIRELFFPTIFKPLKPINLRESFVKTVKPLRKMFKPQELSGNCQYLHRLMSLRPHLKRINIGFLTKMSWWKLEKIGKTLRKSGKNQGIWWDKKSGNPDCGNFRQMLFVIFWWYLNELCIIC